MAHREHIPSRRTPKLRYAPSVPIQREWERFRSHERKQRLRNPRRRHRRRSAPDTSSSSPAPESASRAGFRPSVAPTRGRCGSATSPSSGRTGTSRRTRPEAGRGTRAGSTSCWTSSRTPPISRSPPSSAGRWRAAAAFLLVTQNVDPLHERAGSERLVKVHGSVRPGALLAARLACTARRAGRSPRADIGMSRVQGGAGRRQRPALPVVRRAAPSARALVRRVLRRAPRLPVGAGPRRGADSWTLCLFVGTSFSVGVTDLFLRGGLMNGPAACSRSTPAPPRRRTRRSRCSANLRRILLPAVCGSALARSRSRSSGLSGISVKPIPYSSTCRRNRRS